MYNKRIVRSKLKGMDGRSDEGSARIASLLSKNCAIFVRTSDFSVRRLFVIKRSNRNAKPEPTNCAMLGSNQRLLACEASALPLS
jgi:hypothetical protein